MKEKLASVLRRVFAVGILCLLALATLIIVLYLIAFAVGGDTAAAITDFVMNKFFPVLFVINIICCAHGLIFGYLTGNRSFRFDAVIEEERKHVEDTN